MNSGKNKKLVLNKTSIAYLTTENAQQVKAGLPADDQICKTNNPKCCCKRVYDGDFCIGEDCPDFFDY